MTLTKVLPVLLAVGAFANFAHATKLSSSDPTRFRFTADPLTPIFAPGNSGVDSFETTPTRNAANTAYNEERKTEGLVLDLFRRSYNFYPVSADAGSTQPAGYYARLAGTVLGSAQYGRMVDCRITSELGEELARNRTTWADYLGTVTASLRNGPGALISIDLPADQAKAVFAAGKDLPGRQLMGIVCRTPEQLEHARHFEFAVVNETVVPPEYGTQAAVPYLRARVGQIPILMESTQPRFHKELVWLATGAAGIQYQNDLPALESPDHETAWRNLRALSTFPRRLGGKFRLATELVQPGVFGALIGENHSWCVFPLLNAAFELDAPEPPEDMPEAIGSWYNPVTDENLYLPRVSATTRRTRLRTPSPDPWVYIHNALPASGDQDSTTTLIVPEIDWPEDAATTETE